MCLVYYPENSWGKAEDNIEGEGIHTTVMPFSNVVVNKMRKSKHINFGHICAVLTQRWQNVLFTSLTSENLGLGFSSIQCGTYLGVIKDMSLIIRGSKGLLSSQIQRLWCSLLSSIDLWTTDRQNVIEKHLCWSKLFTEE